MAADSLSPTGIRVAYEQATAWYVERVAALRADQWPHVGLGEWTVRELVAHGARSFKLVTDYLASDRSPGAAPTARGPVAYWATIFGSIGDDAESRARLASQVAERGRQDALALGDDPVHAVWAMADASLNRLAVTDDGAIVTSPFGSFTLVDFLPSRVTELVVHGLDVCRATGQPCEPPAAALATAGDALVRFADPVRLVLSLTGRTSYAVLS
jgi:Mycothiol maleylpyruvate isomerase N-terminal domain